MHTSLLNLSLLSIAFDKVWHVGLIFRLKSTGIFNALLEFIESFLVNIFQRVVLNNQTSEWLHVKAGVPQSNHFRSCLIYIS